MILTLFHDMDSFGSGLERSLKAWLEASLPCFHDTGRYVKINAHFFVSGSQIGCCILCYPQNLRELKDERSRWWQNMNSEELGGKSLFLLPVLGLFGLQVTETLLKLM